MAGCSCFVGGKWASSELNEAMASLRLLHAGVCLSEQVASSRVTMSAVLAWGLLACCGQIVRVSAPLRSRRCGGRHGQVELSHRWQDNGQAELEESRGAEVGPHYCFPDSCLRRGEEVSLPNNAL